MSHVPVHHGIRDIQPVPGLEEAANKCFVNE